MTGARPGATDRAAELRAAFDRSFALPVAAETAPKEDLLIIRAGSEACAVRLSEIGALFADTVISPLPGGDATRLGIAGFRDRILPVYGLAALLGNAAGAAPRFLAVVAGAQIALAFEALDGHVRVSRDAIVAHQRGAGARSHVRELLDAPDGVRPVIHLGSIVELIRGHAPGAASLKE
jgi:purine-binding chemotaxis protein CheW